MHKFSVLRFLALILILTFYTITTEAQNQVSIETSRLVSTSKKTDFAQIVLEKDNGHIFVLVQDYNRELRWIHEFDEKMKFKKSTKLKRTKDRVVAARFDNNDLILFAVESHKGKGKIYKVNFIKEKLELINKELFDIDLKGSGYRRKSFIFDKQLNIIDEKKYLGSVDSYGYPFYSDNGNFIMISYSRNIESKIKTLFGKGKSNSYHSITVLNSDFDVLKTYEFELESGGFDYFSLKDINYLEKNKTFVFHGRVFPHKNNKLSRKELRVEKLGIECIYFVKEGEKPRMLTLQSKDELVIGSNIKLQDNLITIASVVYPKDYDNEENTEMSVRVSEYDFETLSETSKLDVVIPEYSFRGEDKENFLFNSFKIPILEKVDNRFVLGLYNYDSTIPQWSSKSNQLISYWRHRGQYQVFNIAANNGELLNHYILDREVYVKQSLEKARNNETLISGLHEYWNNGVNSIFNDGKILFFLNADKITIEDNKLTYSTKKIKKDLELVKSKPYLVTLDFDNGFSKKTLGKKTAGINGLMVEKMFELKDGVFISNTPLKKKKKYVKISLN
jgi:hypothetical protein